MAQQYRQLGELLTLFDYHFLHTFRACKLMIAFVWRESKGKTNETSFFVEPLCRSVLRQQFNLITILFNCIYLY